MKKLLLATVATIALSSSGVLAAEPSAHGGGMSAGSEMKGHAPGKAETTGSGATENKSQAAPNRAASPSRSETTGAASDDGMKPNAEPRAKPQSDTKSHSNSGKASSTNRRETTGAGASEERSGTHSRDSSSGTMKNGSGSAKSSSDEKADSSRNASGSRAGSQSSTTTTGSGGSTASLTADQKTKIRTTVIDKGPKIEKSKINFSINVGTVVPRSVHVVSVPTVLIDIHPEWRGYRYFVVGDELVIVEPDSLKIVAVLVV